MLMRSLRVVLVSLLVGVAGYAASPSVIVILADDLGWGDVGFHGCKDVPTPAIDSLAANGVSFSAGYSAAPVCGPSRAGLLTGRYQNRFGYHDNIGPWGRAPGIEQGMPLEIKTMGDYFRELNYVTGMIGKWHDGDDDKFWPHNRGFGETFAFNNGAANYFVGEKNATTDKWGAVHRDGKRLPKVGPYLTDEFSREAVDFVRRHAERPYLLYLAYNAVHGPMQATKADLAKFRDIKDGKRRTLAAMLHAMDRGIGELLAALRETGQHEKTIVIFTSDNGGKPKGNASLNGHLRGEKGTVFEGGIRVPFVVQWQGQIAGGKRLDDPVHGIDVLPTVLAAAGRKPAEKDKFDGVDLLPLLRGEIEQLPDRYLYWRLNTKTAVRNRTWKLIQGQNKDTLLFNLAKDESEKRNVAVANPERTTELQRLQKAWDHSNEPSRWGWNPTTCPHFIGYRDHQTDPRKKKGQ
jgi:arylsulfatase A-like enzyme